ncbi:hypothetical protein PC113_g14966 [Phytophthora cactorum]|uniref:Uncharacterized protein n=1 Tax=Phytophthora cactorum TaxID=29920 RepID=A0A8T1BUQ0_9STRA|nr:hypothetical protein PC113_g14966 [Phytophthora cactorum]KAG2906880.1 hypothetical protein PC115_g14120 [Phytophthora cactorum]KAG3031077.1 hypothetical protein PC120_g3362 [Phytophthora cactorum]KAG4058727.1 hypothetical protein PC123_g6325 [Phytophthora cactorum]
MVVALSSLGAVVRLCDNLSGAAIRQRLQLPNCKHVYEFAVLGSAEMACGAHFDPDGAVPSGASTIMDTSALAP